MCVRVCVCGVFIFPLQNVIYFQSSETDSVLLRLTGAVALIHFSDMLVSFYRLLLQEAAWLASQFIWL